MNMAEASVVRHHVIVDAPIDRAFTVFTERFGDFRPPEHNLRGARIAETTFEPRVGGHISDHAVDGTECRWARVLGVRAAGSRGVQLGHQPQLAGRDQPRPHQRSRSPVHRRDSRTHPTRTRIPPPRQCPRPAGVNCTMGIVRPWVAALRRSSMHAGKRVSNLFIRAGAAGAPIGS